MTAKCKQNFHLSLQRHYPLSSAGWRKAAWQSHDECCLAPAALQHCSMPCTLGPMSASWHSSTGSSVPWTRRGRVLQPLLQQQLRIPAFGDNTSPPCLRIVSILWKRSWGRVIIWCLNFQAMWGWFCSESVKEEARLCCLTPAQLRDTGWVATLSRTARRPTSRLRMAGGTGTSSPQPGMWGCWVRWSSGGQLWPTRAPTWSCTMWTLPASCGALSSRLPTLPGDSGYNNPSPYPTCVYLEGWRQVTRA